MSAIEHADPRPLLPPHVAARVQRILDSEARRILEQVQRQLHERKDEPHVRAGGGRRP